MYLIPYFKKEELTSSGNRLLKIVLFLSNGGTSLLSDIQESHIDSFCQDNGFFIKNKYKTQNGIFLQVNTKETDISSYYSYLEAYKTKNECWRTFILVFSDDAKDLWNVNNLFQDTPFYKALLDIANKKEVV